MVTFLVTGVALLLSNWHDDDDAAVESDVSFSNEKSHDVFYVGMCTNFHSVL